jgi:hypothetical protein
VLWYGGCCGYKADMWRKLRSRLNNNLEPCQNCPSLNQVPCESRRGVERWKLFLLFVYTLQRYSVQLSSEVGTANAKPDTRMLHSMPKPGSTVMFMSANYIIFLVYQSTVYSIRVLLTSQFPTCSLLTEDSGFYFEVGLLPLNCDANHEDPC